MPWGFFAKLSQTVVARTVFRMEFSDIMELLARRGFVKVGAIEEGWEGNVYVRCFTATRQGET